MKKIPTLMQNTHKNPTPCSPKAPRFARKTSLLLGLLAPALFFISMAHAEVVLDTGYSTTSYTTIGNGAPGNIGSKAVSFEATESFNEFTTLSFGFFLGGLSYAEGAGNVAINLYSSTGSPAEGALPGSQLSTIALIPIENFNGTQIGSFWTGNNLSAGSRSAGWYWLVADTSAVSDNGGELNWTVAVQGGVSNRGAYFDTYSDPQVWTQDGMPLTSAFAEISVVPEPSTYAMVLVGLTVGGLSMWRRSRRA